MLHFIGGHWLLTYAMRIMAVHGIIMRAIMSGTVSLTALINSSKSINILYYDTAEHDINGHGTHQCIILIISYSMLTL